MTSTPQKWLLGCGLGCAALIAILITVIAGGVMFIRGRFQPLEQAAASRNKLVSALGTPETYFPSPNGAVSPEKMESFLSVREQLKESQQRLESVVLGFDFDRLEKKKPSFSEVLGIINGISAIISPFGEYYAKRNQALLDRKMSLGEYLYIYSLVYHTWLGHKPEEGPPLFSRDARTGRNSSFSPEIIRSQYRRLFIRMLENQLRGVSESDKSDLRAALKKEMDRLESDFGRRVWQDGLPAPLEASFSPYRARLESLYNRTTNCFELLQLDERRNQIEWSYDSDKGTEAEESGRPVQAEAEPAAATPASDSAIQITYSVANGVLAPVPEEKPFPAATEESRKAGVKGVMELRGIVRKDGSIDSVRIVRGLGHGLDESAIRTISTDWKFRPGRLNGSPVDVPADIEIRFVVK